MRTSTLPPIRVDDEFRAAVESVLREGETLTAFVEGEMRRAVQHRLVQREFVARAQGSWETFKRTGIADSADDVFARVEARLKAKMDARRDALAGE